MMESVEVARVENKQVCGGERWWKTCVNEVTEGKKAQLPQNSAWKAGTQSGYPAHAHKD